MVIWRGILGFLSFMVPAVFAALVIALHNSNSEGFLNSHMGMLFFFSVVGSSAIISLLCRNYNNKKEYEHKHTIFFVPAEYLFVIWLIMGLAVLILPTSFVLGLF